jgi:hypothetical protein
LACNADCCWEKGTGGAGGAERATTLRFITAAGGVALVGAAPLMTAALCGATIAPGCTCAPATSLRVRRTAACATGLPFPIAFCGTAITAPFTRWFT